MGFVCLAIDSDGTLSGRPMSVCHPPDGRTGVSGLGQVAAAIRTCVVTNTARGEWLRWTSTSASHRSRSGSVWFQHGASRSMPETLAASPDGCLVVTANRNSCDFGLVIRRACWLRCSGQRAPHRTWQSGVAVAPKTNSGRLLNASPKEIVFLLPPPGTVPGCARLAIPRRMWSRPGRLW